MPDGDTGASGDSGVPGENFTATPQPAPQSNTFLNGLSSGGLKLSAPVGFDAANRPDDVFRVESALSGADILKRPPGRAFGDDTLGAIKAAQGRLNADTRLDLAKSPLKIDGLVNPDGPTHAATRRLAGDVLVRRAPIMPGPQPRSPMTDLPPKPRSMVTTPSDPRRETLEQSVKRFAKTKPQLTPALGAPQSPMTAEQTSSLERLAGGLKKTTHPGPVARNIADAFRTNAPGGGEFKLVRDALSAPCPKTQGQCAFPLGRAPAPC
jgi:hypothetical protein